MPFHGREDYVFQYDENRRRVATCVTKIENQKSKHKINLYGIL